MALTSSRGVRPKKFSSMDLASTNEQVWKGGLACIDRTTGFVKKGAASVSLIPIGFYADDKLVTGNAKVTIDLFHEVWAQWMVNRAAGEAVVAGSVGGLCYIFDDNTVGVDDDTNTLSVAGSVWAVDAVKGVLVEFRATNDSRLGGLDA